MILTSMLNSKMTIHKLSISSLSECELMLHLEYLYIFNNILNQNC